MKNRQTIRAEIISPGIQFLLYDNQGYLILAITQKSTKDYKDHF